MLGGSTVVTAALPQPTEARVFARLFLKEKPPLRLSAGYYDHASQLHVDATSQRPMFVDVAEGPVVPLSESELDEVLKSGKYVDLRDLPKMRTAATTTLRSLSTTSCCPIVTDSTPDQVQD